MNSEDQKSTTNSQKPQGKKKPDAAKSKRLEDALRNNLSRRKEAQKSRPHRKNLPPLS